MIWNQREYDEESSPYAGFVILSIVCAVLIGRSVESYTSSDIGSVVMLGMFFVGVNRFMDCHGACDGWFPEKLQCREGAARSGKEGPGIHGQEHVGSAPVAKRGDHPIAPGDRRDWIKVKNPDAPAVTRLIEE